MRVHRCAYLTLQVTTGDKDFHSYEMGLGTRAAETLKEVRVMEGTLDSLGGS